MSRDFKQEYENYINEQTPDLWNRIEAGLAPKEVSATPIPVTKKKIPARFWTYGLTAAAAVVICMVALPMLNGGLFRGKSDSAMEADMSVNMAADMETAGMSGGTAYDGAGGMWQEAVEEGAMPGAEKPVEEEAALEAETEKQSQTLAVTEDAVEEMKSAMDNGASGALADGFATGGSGVNETPAQTDGLASTEILQENIFEAEVEILTLSEEEGRTIFQAMLNGGTVLIIFSEEFSEDAMLFEGETYVVTLEEAGEGDSWDYVIVSMGAE